MTTRAAAPTASELLTVMSARLLRDGQVVFAGVGIPLLAATLAQRLHAPGLTILFEGGTLGAFVEPGKLPPSTNEQRCTRRANMVLGSTDEKAWCHAEGPDSHCRYVSRLARRTSRPSRPPSRPYPLSR